MSTRVHFHLPFPSAYKCPPSSSSLSNFVLVLSVIRMRGCSLVTRSSTRQTFVLGFHNLLRSPPPSSSCKYSSVFRNSPPSSLTSTSSCAVGRRKPFLGSFRFVLGMSSGSSSAKEPQSIHDFTVKDVKGNDVSLRDYKGKVLLVVNVASECGLTNSNYKELNELYGKYKEKGLEILAFPSNQFGGQEPGSNEQIVERACSRFKAEFPVFGKVDVNGDNADPVYKYLKNSKSSLLGNGIKWNFAKFLVDQEGRVVDRYMPTTSPMSIEKDIKKLLGVSS